MSTRHMPATAFPPRSLRTFGSAGSLRGATALAAVFAICLVPASVAQDGGLPDVRRLGLTFSNELTAVDNARLSTDSDGVTSRATSRLGVEVEVRDPLNVLLFSTSTALRYTDRPDRGTATDIDNPRLALSYRRTGATASLRLNASFRNDDITFLRPLTDLVPTGDDILDPIGVEDDLLDPDLEPDPDDVDVADPDVEDPDPLDPDVTDPDLVVPEDLDDLTGTGTRSAYSTRAVLAIAEDAPVSLSFNLGVSGRTYSDVSNADLFDTQTLSYGATARFAFVPGVITGRLRYGASRYRAEDSVDTERDRQLLNASVSAAISPVLSGRVSLGYSQIETRRSTGTTSVDGLTAGAGLTLARPNGAIRLDFSRSTNVNGERNSVNLRRNFVLPQGRFSGNFGATQLGAGEFETIAGLNYSTPLPNGSLAVGVNRSVRFLEDEDRDQLVTSLNVRHTYQITDISSVSFQAAFADTGDSRRSSLATSYSRAITEDWSVNGGYEYTRLTQTERDRDSHRVFVRLGRSFDFPF